MKVKNLKAKLFIIPVDGAKDFNLMPASGEVELPTGYNATYIERLAKVGNVAITEQDEVKEELHVYTFDELDALHYKKVDVIAESLGVSTDGNKDETIALILEAQEG